MKYINLTEDYNPLNKSGDSLIKFEYFEFKGGEPHIKIEQNMQYYVDITITVQLNSFNDVGKLMVTVDAIRHMNVKYLYETRIHLYVPYFPGARQDRVMVVGEPLTVKIYADLINSLNFKTVTIVDPHSDVTPALLNNVVVIDNHKFVLKVLQDIYPKVNSATPYLVSPDSGANKKVSKLATYLSDYNTLEVVKADKTRNVKTGKITDFVVYKDDLGGRDCVIVDDICDGGGTFIGLAKELKKKNAGNLYLVVTHGIFSKGEDELLKYYDKIYTSDSIMDEIQSEELIVLTIK